MYLRAFGKMMEERKRKGKKTDMWKTPEDVMAWFLMENEIGPENDTLVEYVSKNNGNVSENKEKE